MLLKILLHCPVESGRADYIYCDLQARSVLNPQPSTLPVDRQPSQQTLNPPSRPSTLPADPQPSQQTLNPPSRPSTLPADPQPSQQTLQPTRTANEPILMSEYVAESINQTTDCRTFRPRRSSSTEFCMQLTKAYVIETSCNQLFD